MSETRPTVAIRRARPGDQPHVERLLAAAGLPVEGVADHFGHYLVAVTARGVVGAIGLETYGAYGLLRSAVVEPGSQGRGIGDLLTIRVLEDARARGMRAVYLLTTTAAAYFERFRFRRVERASLPAELGASAELRGACPESAVAMALELAP
jgi:amino-acid N-acetyltransferase